MSAEEEHGHHGHGDDAHEHGHDHDGHGHAHPHEHGHDHDHDGHGHAHPHGHHHAHARPAAHDGSRPGLGKLPPIAPLARGAGVGLTLFLDPVAGIAGDMTIGALVDLGVPPRVVEEAVAALGLDGYRLVFGSRVHHGIVAAAFDVIVAHDQPHRTYRDVRVLLENASLGRGVRDRAERIFAKLAVAESRIHRTSLDDVHFHEVGAVDALADVVGTAAALDYLGVERILVAPLPIGRGFVNAGHGRVPLPAPATAELLRGFPIAPVDFEGELVTPTGAAIVAALAKPAPSFPRCVLERTGFGAGTKSWPDRPNVLRVALLRETLAQGEPEAFELLEANLDDANPEWLAHAVERLVAAGARDAWLTPITMKKGRAAVTLAVLAPTSLAGALAELVFAETTAIGLRRTSVARTELAREIVDVETPWGPVPVKVVHVRGVRRGKPEFEDCRRIADEHGVPVRAVAEAALAALAKGAPSA